MTLDACRFNIEFEDHDVSRDLNLAHWGVANWIGKRMKGMKEQLSGPEVNGINIVNIHFWDDLVDWKKFGQWSQLVSSLQFHLLVGKDFFREAPMENIVAMMRMASTALLASELPQRRALGVLLSEPLNDVDIAEIKKHMDKHREKWSL